MAWALLAISCAPGTHQPAPRFAPGDAGLDAIASMPAAPAVDSTRIVTTWAEELRGTSGVHLFARNDRSRPVRVTKVAITLCQNIRGGCIEWDPGIVLKPGEKRRIYTILPDDGSRGYRYQWRTSGREERPLER